MDREAWQAIVHGVTRDGHDLASKLPYVVQHGEDSQYFIVTMNGV